MSIFYDHLITLEDIEKELNSFEGSDEELHELWHVVDEILHHRILELLLDHLPRNHHEEFLSKFYLSPHDTALIRYLNEKIKEDIEELIRNEVKKVSLEIIKDIYR